MTDNEIIKGLSCCMNYAQEECTSCPMRDVSWCMDKLHRSTIDLIKRQKAEIERLEKDLMKCKLEKEMTGGETK